MNCRVKIGGREFVVQATDGAAEVVVDGRRLLVHDAAGPCEKGAVMAEDGARRLLVRAVPGTAESGTLRLLAGGLVVEARIETERDRLLGLSRPARSRSGPITARSTLPGVIRRIFHQPGDLVEDGTPLLTLEAMKMENEVRAEARGRIRALLVREGQVVNAGDPLVDLEPDGDPARP